MASNTFTEEEYEIQAIRDYDEETDLSKIRWKNFGAKDDTWEPRENIEDFVGFFDFLCKYAKKHDLP